MAKGDIRTTVVYSVITCLAIPPIIAFLIYTDQLYNVAQFNNYHVLLAFTGIEFLKKAVIKAYKDDHKDYKPLTKSHNRNKLREIFKCIFLTILMTVLYFVTATLFGASLITKYEETLMLSLELALFTVFASCLHVGVDTTKSLLFGADPKDDVSKMIQFSIQCTIFGAWIGAVVIPLDWNRPWQQWPIPCWLGALAGYVLAHVLSLVKLIPIVSRVISIKKKSYNKLIS